jgi:proteasome lid subunit RPN8/RPN11
MAANFTPATPAANFMPLEPWFDRPLIESLIRDLGPQILAHATEALPEECVGLIWNDFTISKLINQARSAERFSISGAQWTEVVMDKGEAAELVAIYHSHPKGNREFSQADIDVFMDQRKEGYPFAWVVVTPDGYASVMQSREANLFLADNFTVLIDQYDEESLRGY